MGKHSAHIGFVSTRLSGTDGVSLETRKWVDVLNKLDCECYFFAGASEWGAERSYILPEAHFSHPEIQAINSDLFDNFTRSSMTSGKIHKLRFFLKEHLYKFIKQYSIELLIVENALSIPMNIPLGLAITELVAETGLPAIAHHHDFAWERSRFKISSASDFQFGSFPPVLPSVRHVVINSYASRQLALRTGLSSIIIPNVMDFANPPPKPDEYARDLRNTLGVLADEIFLLQPTRIVPRKRIELAIEIARRLERPCSLVISHSAGDEGEEYKSYLKEHARLLGVHVLFASRLFAYERGQSKDGSKIYSLRDAYQAADLVTYPSSVEGFGNAFLETVYYKQPIVLSMYESFRMDILPKGFKVIGFQEFITDNAVSEINDMLVDSQKRASVVEHNYKIGEKYFSYQVLATRLAMLLNECLGLKL